MPLERGREAVEAMRELMLASQPAAIFPMEVRTTAADDAYLSANYGTATTVISVSGRPGHDYWDYLYAVDQLLGQFGARVHWGKLHYLTPAHSSPSAIPRASASSPSAASSTPRASSSTSTCGRSSREVCLRMGSDVPLIACGTICTVTDGSYEWPMRA